MVVMFPPHERILCFWNGSFFVVPHQLSDSAMCTASDSSAEDCDSESKQVILQRAPLFIETNGKPNNRSETAFQISTNRSVRLWILISPCKYWIRFCKHAARCHIGSLLGPNTEARVQGSIFKCMFKTEIPDHFNIGGSFPRIGTFWGQNENWLLIGVSIPDLRTNNVYRPAIQCPSDRWFDEGAPGCRFDPAPTRNMCGEGEKQVYDLEETWKWV